MSFSFEDSSCWSAPPRPCDISSFSPARGMDDVSNLAKVLQRLIHEGCSVGPTGAAWAIGHRHSGQANEPFAKGKGPRTILETRMEREAKTKGRGMERTLALRLSELWHCFRLQGKGKDFGTGKGFARRDGLVRRRAFAVGY